MAHVNYAIMFSKACKYAIRAVLYLSVHSSEDQKLGAREIAEAIDVPKPYLAKILQQLSKHKLISSSKGTGGGFYLTERDRGITLRGDVHRLHIGIAGMFFRKPLPLTQKSNGLPKRPH